MGHSEDGAVHKIPHKMKMNWQNQLKIWILVWFEILYEIIYKKIDFILVQCQFKGGQHIMFGHFYFVTLLLNKLKKVHKSIPFQKGNFTRNTLVMSNFDQNSQILRKSHTQKKHIFCHFLFKMGLKLTKILNINFDLLFLDLKHLIWLCIFSFLQIFANFLSSMPNKAKNSTIYQIFKFLTLFGM